MPVLESTEKIAPKSVLRHRPIGGTNTTQGQNSGNTTTTPIARRASRGRAKEETDAGLEIAEWQRADELETAPSKGSASAAAGRKTGGTRALPKEPKEQQQEKETAAPKAAPLPGKVPGKAPKAALPTKSLPSPRALRAHPLLYLGTGMLLMLGLWSGLMLLINWAHATIDDLQYGRPRTFQTDAFVGHNEQAGIPSHFIAINLNRHIEIIELPGGDASHARIYSGPQLYGSDDELVPVTLKFADVNGDRKPDMIVSFQGTQIVFINDGSSFRPLRPDERPQVERYLQQHNL